MGRKVMLFAVALLVLIQGPIGVLAQDNQTKTLYELMSEQAIRDDQPSEFVNGENGIDFKESSSNENLKPLSSFGLWLAVTMMPKVFSMYLV